MRYRDFQGMGTNIRILFILTGVFVCILPSCSLGNNENLQGEIVIENNSTYQVVEFYVTLEGSEEWGENLLAAPVEPGETRTIASLPREEVKAKAVFLNGTDTFENVTNNLNLLLNSKLTLDLQA